MTNGRFYLTRLIRFPQGRDAAAPCAAKNVRGTFFSQSGAAAMLQAGCRSGGVS